ncbi:MerR family transcriptional regulator, partial [Peribacillus frigoritolerans]|uniref:MerR family transcriptional regulator n=2 Tax=Bacillaceae TaxID=186817 RepID=UPI002E20059B
DYRYYDQNQLLAAKRINLLKQAGFTLNEIREIINEKLSNEEINNLIDEKLHLEMNKVKAANQAINQLEILSNMITKSNNEVKKEYIEPVTVYEYNIEPNKNICVALNNSDEMIKGLKVIVKDKIIKYKLIDDQIYPVSIALQVENQLNYFVNTSYFGFDTTQFYYEVNPYQEESALKIKEIMENNQFELSEPYIYERILNP